MKMIKTNPFKMWFTTVKSPELVSEISGLYLTKNADAATMTNALKILGNGSMQDGLKIMTKNTARKAIEQSAPKIFQEGFRTGSLCTAALIITACGTFYVIKKIEDNSKHNSGDPCAILRDVINGYAEEVEIQEGIMIKTPAIAKIKDEWIITTSDDKKVFQSFIEASNYTIDLVAKNDVEASALKKKFEQSIKL